MSATDHNHKNERPVCLQRVCEATLSSAASQKRASASMICACPLGAAAAEAAAVAADADASALFLWRASVSATERQGDVAREACELPLCVSNHRSSLTILRELHRCYGLRMRRQEPTRRTRERTSDTHPFPSRSTKQFVNFTIPRKWRASAAKMLIICAPRHNSQPQNP